MNFLWFKSILFMRIFLTVNLFTFFSYTANSSCNVICVKKDGSLNFNQGFSKQTHEYGAKVEFNFNGSGSGAGGKNGPKDTDGDSSKANNQKKNAQQEQAQQKQQEQTQQKPEQQQQAGQGGGAPNSTTPENNSNRGFNDNISESGFKSTTPKFDSNVDFKPGQSDFSLSQATLAADDAERGFNSSGTPSKPSNSGQQTPAARAGGSGGSTGGNNKNQGNEPTHLVAANSDDEKEKFFGGGGGYSGSGHSRRGRSRKKDGSGSTISSTKLGSSAAAILKNERRTQSIKNDIGFSSRKDPVFTGATRAYMIWQKKHAGFQDLAIPAYFQSKVPNLMFIEKHLSD